MIDKWGRKEIVGDYVRLIRTLRPDVIVTMNIQGRGGDRAHEATTVLVREAYSAPRAILRCIPNRSAKACVPGSRRSCTSAPAWADPAVPEEGAAAEGRAPRRPDSTARAAARRAAREADAGQHRGVRRLLGRTYAEIGSDARSNHKCQGDGRTGRRLTGTIGGGRGGRARRGGADTSSWRS